MYAQYNSVMGSGGSSQDKPAADTVQSKEEINAELDDMRKRMMEVWHSGNPEGFKEFYTEDVHQIMPGAGIVIGRDEVINRAKKEMDSVETLTTEVVGREIRDTMVSEVVKFKLKLKAMEKEIPGKSMITYIKDPADGKWKIKYDMDVPDGTEYDY